MGSWRSYDDGGLRRGSPSRSQRPIRILSKRSSPETRERPFWGLSATPGRTWAHPDADAAVAELFHGNKVMLDFGGANPVKHLTDDGYLAAVDFSLLNVEPGLRLSSTDLRGRSRELWIFRIL